MSKLQSQGWRFARCGPIATVLKLETFELPVGKDDVVVKVQRAPLHRVDSAIVNGSALGRKIASSTFPRIGGSECVGTVVRAGNSSSVKEGDCVWVAPGCGAWSQTVVCNSQLVHKIDTKHLELATTASNFLVAQELLDQASLDSAKSAILQNGGSSLTALAVAALAQEQNVTVFSMATPGDRFAPAEERLKAFNSRLFQYNASGARKMLADQGSRHVQLFLNGVGGRSFNDCLKTLGDNATVVSFGAQNGFGLMWAGSNQIYRQTTMRGFSFPSFLVSTKYEDRQAKLSTVLNRLAAKNLKYPVSECRSLDKLPVTWDSAFVKGGCKGVLVL